MDTREKLREQKKSLRKRFGSVFGLGLGLGIVMGFGSYEVSGGGFAPDWFYFLVAYVLGGLTVLLYWRLTGLKKKADAELLN